MRKNDEYVGRRMMTMIQHEKRLQGRQKRRWIDCVEADMKEKSVDKEWVYDRPEWWSRIRVSDST